MVKISKDLTNLEIVALLKAVAAAYQIKNATENRFRIVAYQRAADAVEHLSSEAKDLWDDGKLKEIAGIGSSIEGHLDEIFSTGKSRHFQKVMRGLHTAMFDLINVYGIGPRTAYKLARELKVSSNKPLDNLLKKAQKGEIAKLEGFGEDSQEAIIKSIGEYKGRERRLLLPYAEKIASEVISWLKKNKFAEKVDPLGSLRRRVSTVGDVDIAVATTNPKNVIEHFCLYPKATRVLEKGESSASIIIPGDKQVDLMVQKPKMYGALLQHFTGSKHHNIALREHAIKHKMSLSEHGIKSTNSNQEIKINTFKDEKSFYKFLGMDWIPPELREDTGEIEAAIVNQVPNLIEKEDVKVDLQIHSDFDIETSHDLGESSMQDLVKKANQLGYEYIAFTEHNPSQRGHNSKQMIDLLKRKKEKIDKINYSLSRKNPTSPRLRGARVRKVFNSLEVDVMPSGKLPLTEKALELLDFVFISVHSSFRQDRKLMTKRLLTAFDHPNVKVLAHPTARKINYREGIELDWPQMFDYCKKNNKWLEINADPMRLDLPDLLVKDAIREGVMLTLGTDAHHSDMMDNMTYGISVARRGWAEKENIVNTMSLKDFEKMLK